MSSFFLVKLIFDFLSRLIDNKISIEFSCNGYNVENAASGGYQIARIRGIKAADLGNILTLTVSGGTVKYSPMNYCKNVLADGNQTESLQNVAKAVYLYWKAASAFFNGEPSGGNMIDLSKLAAGVTELTLQDGDVLTGTLSDDKKIMIAEGATVKLNNVNIALSGGNYAGITPLGDATIILSGTNTVSAGYYMYLAIYAAEGYTLTIDGDGSLEAASNGWAAGIGGGYQLNAGNIVISGGTITATGGNSAAGIGSAFGSTVGDIWLKTTVTKVTAIKGKSSPSSIGKGDEGHYGGIYIGNNEDCGMIRESPYTYEP